MEDNNHINGRKVRVGCLQYSYPGIKEQMESAEVTILILILRMIFQGDPLEQPLVEYPRLLPS